MRNKIVGDVVETLIMSDARKATKYLSSEYVIKATRKLFGGKIHSKAKTIDIVLTIGRPNFEERGKIRELKSAGEPFPVKKIHLKFPIRKTRGI